MIYAISDLHGCYEKYEHMMQILSFNDSDTLYILGDIVDRGSGGIRILQDMMQRRNIIPFWGNHDYMAYYLLKILCGLKTAKGIGLQDASVQPYDLLKDSLMDEWQMWMEIGGDKTYKAFMTLNADSQKKILDYMDTFCFFKELDVNGKKFFLSHTVPDRNEMAAFFTEQNNNFAGSRTNYEYDFITDVPEHDKIYFEDRYFVTGHTPTGYIDKRHIGKIIQRNNHIAIDCGAVFGMPLGCVCLDTLEEFYVYF